MYSTRDRLILGPIIVLSAALAFAMLTKGHDWGDDFAAYIMQARSILGGTERQTISDIAATMQRSSRAFGPMAYPWGFPTLLAPVYLACGGQSILCLKLVNLPSFALFLLAFFPFLARRLRLFDSALLVSILAFNPALLAFHNNVLSDVVFLFFSTLSILLIDRIVVAPGSVEGVPGGNVRLGVVMFLAFAVRSNGALLVATLFLTHVVVCVRRRSWPRRQTVPVLLIPYIAFGLLAGALLLLLPSGEASSLAFLKDASVGWLFENMSAYAVLPVEFFGGVTYPFDFILYGTLLPFMIAGAVLRHKTDVHILIYVGLTLLLYTAVPFQQGLRYLFPLLPFLIYWAYTGMRDSAFALMDQHRRAGELLTRALWLAILGVFVVTSVGIARANLANQRATDDGPFEASSTELFDFVRNSTAANDVIIFFKPRAMRLMTGRNALLIDTCDQLDRGDYVAVRTKDGTRDQVPAQDIAICSQSVEPRPVFSNQRFIMYRIRHALSRNDAPR